jgi:hypothetical protein
MGRFGGRLQRTSSKAAVAFGIVIVAGVLAQQAASYLGQTSAGRDALFFGTVGSAVGIVGVIVSLIVRALHNPSRSVGGVSPGWYADHQEPNLMRYHDGRSWTSATAPRQQ